jgi:GNAT superfamily N-acetyltransferase
MRRARPADADQLTRIAHAAKRHWRYPEALMRGWRADLTVTPEHITAAPFYCATRGATVLGFYALSGRRARRELEHMWVQPQHLGRGIGRHMFRHLRRVLRRAGVERLRIAADPNAVEFYRRMGATPAGSVASTPPGRRLPVLVLHLGPRAR